MGIHDRPYFREESTYSAGFGGGATGGIMYGLARPGRVVGILLLINIAVIFIQAAVGDIGPAGSGRVSGLFGVTSGAWWQLWRYVTFQFLHAGFRHILLNMLILYMLGMFLERRVGGRRFLWFYLSSGVVAGVTYAIMASLVPSKSGEELTSMPLIGASGGVYAIALACAVWFPDIKIFFIIPIRICVAVAFAAILLLLLSSISTDYYTFKFWSGVAHFGGLLGGAYWIWLHPRVSGARTRMRVKMNQGAWQKKLRQQGEEEKSIDEILQKVHDQGINSLTAKEKKTLAQATRKQRER